MKIYHKSESGSFIVVEKVRNGAKYATLVQKIGPSAKYRILAQKKLNAGTATHHQDELSRIAEELHRRQRIDSKSVDAYLKNWLGHEREPEEILTDSCGFYSVIRLAAGPDGISQYGVFTGTKDAMDKTLTYLLVWQSSETDTNLARHAALTVMKQLDEEFHTVSAEDYFEELDRLKKSAVRINELDLRIGFSGTWHPNRQNPNCPKTQALEALRE